MFGYNGHQCLLLVMYQAASTCYLQKKLVSNTDTGLPRSGKISGNFFQVREKSGNFVDGQGNIERTWKVKEKSGNLKINGYCRQSSENLFILVKRGKDVHSHKIV